MGLCAPCLPLKYVCGGSFYPFPQPFLCVIHSHAHDRCLRFFKHFFSRVRCALAWCVVCELFWLSCVCIVLAPKLHVSLQCGCCVRAIFVLGAFCAPFFALMGFRYDSVGLSLSLKGVVFY